MVPSYGLAQRAHWVILAGIGLLGVVALAALPFVRMDSTIAAAGVIEPLSISRWQAVLRVRDGDTQSITPGQHVTVEIPAVKSLGGRQLEGRVAEIGRAIPGRDALAADGTVPVIVSLDSVQVAQIGLHTLRRGYTVQGRIAARSDRVSRLAMRKLRAWANEHWR